MKIRELEKRINERIAEKGLNKPENAQSMYHLKIDIKQIIHTELELLVKELKYCKDYYCIHNGNRYYGESQNNLYTSLEIILDGCAYIGHNDKFEFKTNMSRIGKYYVRWYTKGIEIEIYGYDKDTDIQDIINKRVAEIKQKKLEIKQKEEKEKEEARQRELEHKKFVEEKTKELLKYIKDNNLDLKEFKTKAKEYTLYCQYKI